MIPDGHSYETALKLNPTTPSAFNPFNSFQIIATSYGHFQSLTAISRLEAI
jgi:hypothetical protein